MRYYEQKYPEVDELVMVQVRQIAEMGAYVKLVRNSGRSQVHYNFWLTGTNKIQLEYDNTEGMILLSELSRRRIRSVQKLIRVGRNEVVVVLRVDKEKGSFALRESLNCFTPLTGYIDLSKRRVSPEDIVKCEERYLKSKTVASILRHVASKIPSLGADGADRGPVPVAESAEKENKKAARKARQAAQEENGVFEHEIPGGANEDEKLEQLYEQIAWPLGKKYGHPYDAFKLALTWVHSTIAVKDVK